MFSILERKIIYKIQAINQKYRGYIPEEHREEFDNDLYSLWRISEVETLFNKLIKQNYEKDLFVGIKKSVH